MSADPYPVETFREVRQWVAERIKTVRERPFSIVDFLRAVKLRNDAQRVLQQQTGTHQHRARQAAESLDRFLRSTSLHIQCGLERKPTLSPRATIERFYWLYSQFPQHDSKRILPDDVYQNPPSIKVLVAFYWERKHCGDFPRIDDYLFGEEPKRSDGLMRSLSQSIDGLKSVFGEVRSQQPASSDKIGELSERVAASSTVKGDAIKAGRIAKDLQKKRGRGRGGALAKETIAWLKADGRTTLVFGPIMGMRISAILLSRFGIHLSEKKLREFGVIPARDA